MKKLNFLFGAFLLIMFRTSKTFILIIIHFTFLSLYNFFFIFLFQRNVLVNACNSVDQNAAACSATSLTLTPENKQLLLALSQIMNLPAIETIIDDEATACPIDITNDTTIAQSFVFRLHSP